MRPISSERLRLLASIALVLVLVVGGPVAYTLAFDSATLHAGPRFVANWTDPGFNKSWQVSSNGPPANLSRGNGTLTISTTTTVNASYIAAAQLRILPSMNVTVNHILIVDVRSSNVYLAVRLSLWPATFVPVILQLSTFNDNLWHTVTIDLAALSLFGNQSFVMLELSFEVVQHSVPAGTTMAFKPPAIGRFAFG